MDVYEKGILLAAIPATVWLGWFWRPLQVLMATVTAFSLLGISSYQAPAELGGATWRVLNRCFGSSIFCPASRLFCG